LITKDKLLERMKVVTDDMSSVKQRMIENERQIKEDTALLNALTGAAQQIQMFLQEFNDEKPDVASDDGKNTISNIPPEVQ
tara:strand:- start:10 stop:252 length:243 start_codon:yes stop_codon:yes gene_type:complete